MADASLPTRLIVCVDGTWCTPDGPHGRAHNNISNVYRIWASIKKGPSADESSRETFDQQKKYYNGLGSDFDIGFIKRLEAGAFGAGFQDQIRDVYEHCCTLSEHPKNEIWLFGFSRGAYVVRAVAGLLHCLRALTSAGSGTFAQDYKQALQVYRKMQDGSKLTHGGRIHHLLAANTREAPKIRFVGVFDTVKAVDDKSLYDISFNDSIQHLRHALALNECRKAYEPEYFFPDQRHLLLPRRSMVQAWFVGAHMDIGGSTIKDGLALYPLQWMLLESRAKGLVLEFDGSLGCRATVDNPLDIIFPPNASYGKGLDMISLEIENGLKVDMQDLRKVHILHRHMNRYAVHLNRSSNIWMKKEERGLFDRDGALKGYCKYAAQGTILHPSVYLIFDEYSHLFLNSKNLTYRADIEKLRPTMLPEDGFWIERETISIEDPGAIRILVCGNSGIGKSTLINEVFGTELTTASARTRGIHNVRDPLICPGRTDLVIHDSGGFETGGDDELRQVKEFIVDTSNATDIRDRLHVIWFCMEINSSRTQQTSAVEIFSALSQNSEIPVVVVGTKKDEFWDMQYGKARKKFADQADMERHADDELRDRMKLMKEEVSNIQDGRCDVMVAVSKDDKKSIQTLTEETAQCFDHEKIRMFYVAAQVTKIDLKIDLAIRETVRIYKHIIRSAAGIGFIPFGTTVNRVTTAVVVCKAIVSAFGVPSVGAGTVQEIVKNLVWDDVQHGPILFIAESIATVGVFGSLILGGMPVFMVAGALNVPLVVPTTARLFLMLACDVILILTRAFKQCADRCVGQPHKRDVEMAAFAYRDISKKVHRKIKDLIPPHNLIKSFQAGRTMTGFQDIVEKYKRKFVEGVGTGSKSKVSDLNDEDD